MADIILAGDSFSLKKLRSAAEQLEDAQNLMQKVYDAVFSTSFWAEANPFALLDGSKNMNVFDGTIDELHTYQQRVHQKEETLRTLAQRMEAAVQELAETDQSFRGKLSGESEKNTWERITGAVRSVRQIVSAAALSLIGAINGLFSSDGTVAGEIVVDPREKLKPMTQDEIDKQNLYTKYENDKYIDKSELKMVIETSKNVEEAEQRIQAIREAKRAAEKLRVNDYSVGVQQGEIRYVNQYDASNGWGNQYEQHTIECCTACQSMALSYLGIDRSPEELLDTGSTHAYNGDSEVRGTPQATQDYHYAVWNQTVVDQKLDDFINDEKKGNVSPVLIHYAQSLNNPPMHWVMLVGKNPDGTYQVVGPVDGEREATVRIENGQITCLSGKLSGLNTSTSSMPLDGYVQYYKKND